MHRVKHLFEQISSMANLHQAAIETLRGKRMTQPGARFFAVMEKEIPTLHDALSSGTYRHGPYHYFQIHEPKVRQVAAAQFRDRVVHHAIVRVLEPIFEKRFIEDSFACRVGKGTHAAMRRALHFARGHRFALKCDVWKFFPSVDHGVLIRLMKRVVGDARVINLLTGILASHTDRVEQEWDQGSGLFDFRTLPKGLPIGNLTSQFMANVYLNPVDHFIKHDLRVSGYVRYMDDFILFGDDQWMLKECGRRVKQKLGEVKLRMHPDKYRLVPTDKGVDFAGFVAFASGRVRVRSSSVKRFDRRFKRMLWEAKNRQIDSSEVRTSVRAWGAHVAHAQSYGLRSTLLGRRRERRRRTAMARVTGAR